MQLFLLSVCGLTIANAAVNTLADTYDSATFKYNKARLDVTPTLIEVDRISVALEHTLEHLSRGGVTGLDEAGDLLSAVILNTNNHHADTAALLNDERPFDGQALEEALYKDVTNQHILQTLLWEMESSSEQRVILGAIGAAMSTTQSALLTVERNAYINKPATQDGLPSIADANQIVVELEQVNYDLEEATKDLKKYKKNKDLDDLDDARKDAIKANKKFERVLKDNKVVLEELGWDFDQVKKVNKTFKTYELMVDLYKAQQKGDNSKEAKLVKDLNKADKKWKKDYGEVEGKKKNKKSKKKKKN